MSNTTGYNKSQEREALHNTLSNHWLISPWIFLNDPRNFHSWRFLTFLHWWWPCSLVIGQMWWHESFGIDLDRAPLRPVPFPLTKGVNISLW